MAPAHETSVAVRINGGLVIWDAAAAGRLAFDRLRNRLQRRDAGADPAATERPAHFVVFDLLRLSGTDTTGWPHRRRRATLKSVSPPTRCRRRGHCARRSPRRTPRASG
ncbi:ATP-dependent DNA ligase [Streptomyces mirabilis]|uniref:ATP-dependent DNA ligase n=1 Tax=Streptomyces mirabilis TaxID=68239 RepID=UPI003675BE46